MFKEKFKASILHLAISILVVFLLLALIIHLWFPEPFLKITDFKDVTIIIIMVDLIIGPILTFIIFNKEKKSLKFDLSVILAIQISALLYGAYSLFQIHPVYITFNQDRFTIVSAKDATPEKAIIDEYKISRSFAGKLAFSQMPDSLEEQNKLLFDVMAGGRDLDQRTEYYRSYKKNIHHILNKSLDSNNIFSTHNKNKDIQHFLKTYGDRIDNFAYLPVNSASKDMILVLNKKDATPVSVINLDPWSL